MPEETRITAKETCITANPLPKENRITADPPSTVDTRICTNYLPTEEEPKSIPLPPLVVGCIAVFSVVMVFLLSGSAKGF